MADTAKGDEIFLQKAAGMTVMDLEILGTSASLASAAVALKRATMSFPEVHIGRQRIP